MNVIKNLEFVCSSGSSCMTPYHGIFKKENAYYINFCHGGYDGSISLEMKNYILPTSPETLRNDINRTLKFKIPTEKIIFISPCNPSSVKEKYKEKLKNNKIFLYSGNWSGLTAMVISNDKRIFNLKDKYKTGSKKITLWVDEYNLEFQEVLSEKNKFKLLLNLKSKYLTS
jgi:hypothetical protein